MSDPLKQLCPDCGRSALVCEVLLAERAGLSGLDVHARLECSQATVERLRANLEKTLGALRPLLDAIDADGHGASCSAYSMMQYDPAKCDCFKHHAGVVRAILSGGAHVGVPKADKAE